MTKQTTVLDLMDDLHVIGDQRCRCAGCGELQPFAGSVTTVADGLHHPFCHPCFEMLKLAERYKKRGMEWVEARERAREKFDPITEAQHCEHAVRVLTEQGFVVEREVAVPGGRIDILATRDGDVWAIEAKRDARLRSVHSAVAQLIAYSSHRPDARLFFTSPWVQLPERTQTTLHKYGIEILAC